MIIVSELKTDPRSNMKQFNGKNFGDRLEAAAKAKQAMMQRAAKPPADDPAVLQKKAEREAIIAAREARIAAKAREEAERVTREAAELARPRRRQQACSPRRGGPASCTPGGAEGRSRRPLCREKKSARLEQRTPRLLARTIGGERLHQMVECCAHAANATQVLVHHDPGLQPIVEIRF